MYITFAQSGFILSDEQVYPILYKVADIFLSSQLGTTNCICSGLYRDPEC